VTPVIAHGVGDAADLPVPLATVLYVAALAVVVTAALAGRRGDRRGATADVRPLPPILTTVLDHPAVRGAVRVAGLLAFAVIAVSAALGPPSAADNPAPRLSYVVAWSLATLLPLLLGDVWPLLNPWRTLAAGVAHLVGDPNEEATTPVPRRWGVWPAVAQLTVVVYVQVLHPHSARVLLLLLAGLTLAQLLGALRYGRTWFAHADPFEVYAGVVARLSPLRRPEEGRLALDTSAERLRDLPARPGVRWILALGVTAAAFDWLIDGPTIHQVRGSLAVGPRLALDSALFLALVLVVSLLMRLATHRLPVLVGAFVPVVVGYAVAHAAGLLPGEGQVAFVQLSDPPDRGWDLLGLSGHVVPLEPVPGTAVAILVVVVLIAAQAWAVLVGHRLARTGLDARTAIAVQLPLRAALVVSVVAGIALRLGTA
jgi:hypothetical protein